MKKLLFAFMAMTLFACSGDDSAPVDPNNGNPENPNPENPNPAECTNVYTGNVWLKTQAEVDAFVAAGYCKIVGELAIGTAPESAPSDITNISELEILKAVTKRIAIINTPVLASLNGLQNIKNVTEILIQQTAITNLIGCPDFVEGATVDIGQSEISLEGFVPKNYMSFTLYGNTDLGYFASYPNVQIFKKFTLLGVKATTLEGLENIRKIGTLTLKYSANLTSLKGLENVTNLTILNVSNNPELISLEHLSGVTSIDFIPEVTDSSSSSYPGIDITANDKLQSLYGLENVSVFGGTMMYFVANMQLSDFCAIRPCLQSKPQVQLNIFNNKYNPTKQNVISGNCSQP